MSSSMSYDSEGAGYYEDSYDSDDDWDTSDSDELGFFTGTHDHDELDDERPPLRMRALEARPCFCGAAHSIPHGPYDIDYADHHDLPRHDCESDLAFKIRKSQWKDVRGLLGPRAMAAGGAGVRLAADAPAGTKGKGKGKASAKGGSKQTGPLAHTPDFFDLANAIAMRAPADVLLALLAVAPTEALRHRWGDEINDKSDKNERKRRTTKDKAQETAREPDFMFEGCSLLHVAMFPANQNITRAKDVPVPTQVVKRLCELDPSALLCKAKRGYTPMYALARFGVATKEADRLTALTVDALAAVSKEQTSKTSPLAVAKGGAAFLVSKLIRGYESDEENAGWARAYPLHAACVRHGGQTVRALLRAFPEAAAVRVETPGPEPGAPRGPNARPPADHSPGFPLHMLLSPDRHGGMPELATFKAVLDAHPDAAKQPGGGRNRGRPAHVLHALCSHLDSPVRLVKCLLKAVPETAQTLEHGETALHYALDSDALTPVARDRRQENPPPAAVEIARAVLRAHPAAAGKSDRAGAFPAHLAVKNKWPPGLVVEVLRAFPDAGTKKGPGRDGTFPLHQATRDGNVNAVKEIVAAFPNLAREATEEDGLPLHVAARHSAPDAVTRVLLESYPAGARKQGQDGELPLHAVCAALGSDDLMYETSEAETENDRRDYENAKLLYAAFPEGAFHTDARGKIPAERLPMYDIHRMLSRDVFGGDAWRGEGWRIMGGGENSGAGGTGGGASQAAHASGSALLVRVAANELAVAAMSAGEIERLTVALDRARAAVSKETLRRPFEEALLAEHDRDEKWMCPIGYGLFRDPVRAGDGHVYERSNIVKWQEKSGAVEPRAPWGALRGEPNKRAWKSPMTGLKCHDFALAPAVEIRKQIGKKLDEMMHAGQKARKTSRDGGDGDGGGGGAAARGRAAKGKAKTAPRGAADGTGPARGAKRTAEGASAPAARARRARR